MRKLASIQRIKSVLPHPNADRLELVEVLGWRCVSGKGNYQPGDLCIYCEIDSVFPDRPEFADFRKRSNRLKTIRLRGEISQGAVLPLSIINECPGLCLEINVGSGRDEQPHGPIPLIKFDDNRPFIQISEGLDVTALLDVTKWEPPVPACISGEVSGPFPSFIPKTDETRIQAAPDVLTRYPGLLLLATEKVDGTSMTIYQPLQATSDDFLNGRSGICGRNYEFKDTTDNSLTRAGRPYLRRIPKGYAVQGELVGEGIQGNPLGLKGQHFMAFNVFDIQKGAHLGVKDRLEFLREHEIPTVPRRPDLDIFLGEETVDSLVRKVSGMVQFGDPSRLAEGAVFRPADAMVDQSLGFFSFKVINPLYLLEHDS